MLGNYFKLLRLILDKIIFIKNIFIDKEDGKWGRKNFR